MAYKKSVNRDDWKLDYDLQTFSEAMEKTFENYGNSKKMCTALKDENRMLKDIHERDVIMAQKGDDLTLKLDKLCQKMDYAATLFESEKSVKHESENKTAYGNGSENAYEEHLQLQGIGIAPCLTRNEVSSTAHELQKQLKIEREVNSKKFHDMVMHYEKLLQQTNNLNDQLREDYSALESKMKSLKNSVSTLQTELSSDINKDFTELRSSLSLNSGHYYSNTSVLKYLYDKNEDEDDHSDFLGNFTGRSCKN